MKQIPLTGKHGKGLFALIDDEDFDRVKNYKWNANKESTTENIRVVCHPGMKKHIVLSKFILKIDGHIKDSIIYKNGNTLDNRKENLKIGYGISENKFEYVTDKEGDYIKFPLSGKEGIGLFAMIDTIDLDKIRNHTWYGDLYGLGTSKKIRVRTRMNNGIMSIHRFILNVTDSKISVDHINGNALDNRRKNLRLCTNRENLYNRGAQVNNVLGVKGVNIDKRKRNKKYVARIGHNNKTVYVGMFATLEEASEARDKKAMEIQKEFAFLNNKEISKKENKENKEKELW